MKKTFNLEHPKIKVPRVVDSVKHKIKSFLKKERKQPLPAEAGYWGFDCKFGQTEEQAVDIELSTLMSQIDDAVANNIMSFYVELNAKPMKSKTLDD